MRMSDDEKNLSAEEAHLAISQAAMRQPKVQRVRDQLQKLASDDEKGAQMLVAAIRKLLHQG
jgi:hypothetical protein